MSYIANIQIQEPLPIIVQTRIGGKEKYGQFAPMISKNALLQLLDEAIKHDFFDRQFLVDLERSIRMKLDELSVVDKG